MDETSFSPIVPGNLNLEPGNNDDVPPPLMKRLDDNNSSDDKSNDEDEVVVEGVDSDDEEISEEAPPEGKGHRVRTPPECYSANFSKIRYAYPDEERMMYMCHHGVGYRAGSIIEKGFVNMVSKLDSLIHKTHPPM